jgi:hypothetical protein
MKATDKVTRVYAHFIGGFERVDTFVDIEDLQGMLDANNACLRYKQKFFDNVEDADLKPEFISFNTGSIHDFGGGYYREPRVDIVPKGTKVEYGMYVLPFTRK